MTKAKALERVAREHQRHTAAREARRQAIAAARTAGATWDEIGDALGTSKQAAWQMSQR
jgi:hypothetical protein